MRKNRPVYSDLTEIEKKKSRCRRISNHARKNGELVPKPCSCGETKVEMHHDDYDKPLEVTWLCVPCHRELHRKEAELKKVGKERTKTAA